MKWTTGATRSSSDLMLVDGNNSTDEGYMYFDSFEGEEAIFATQLAQINMTQHVPYCFEFKFARMNPLNLTDADFGKIEIYAYEERKDRQQHRGGTFLPKRQLHLKDTILPNSTYAADNTWHPYQLRIDNRKFNWMQAFVRVYRGTEPSTRVAFDNINLYNNQCAPMNMTYCDPGGLKTPMWGRMPVGKWICTDSVYIGTKCSLYCRAGFALPALYNGKRVTGTNSCS